MNHNLPFGLIYLSLATCISCGDAPPAFRIDESTSSDSAGETDSASESSTESVTETGTETEVASDTEKSTDSAPDTGPDTGSAEETDTICVDLTGHDEDGDGVPDLCDNCPSVANSSQLSESDDDGLGDDCEATGRPALLERIALFDPFTTPDDAWKNRGGNWTWQDDQVQGSARGGINDISGYFVNTKGLGEDAYAVEATFYHAQAGVSTSWTNFAGIFVAWKNNNGVLSFWTCLYGWSTQILSIWRTEGGGSIERSTYLEDVDSSNFNANIWRRIRGTWDGQSFLCEFENEIGDFATLTPPKEHLWDDMSGRAGLRVYNEKSTFTSFVIYK